MPMSTREYWEATQDPDGTWVAWKGPNVASTGFVDLDEVLHYISTKRQLATEVTIEYMDHTTEVRSL